MTLFFVALGCALALSVSESKKTEGPITELMRDGDSDDNVMTTDATAKKIVSMAEKTGGTPTMEEMGRTISSLQEQIELQQSLIEELMGRSAETEEGSFKEGSDVKTEIHNTEENVEEFLDDKKMTPEALAELHGAVLDEKKPGADSLAELSKHEVLDEKKPGADSLAELSKHEVAEEKAADECALIDDIVLLKGCKKCQQLFPGQLNTCLACGKTCSEKHCHGGDAAACIGTDEFKQCESECMSNEVSAVEVKKDHVLDSLYRRLSAADKDVLSNRLDMDLAERASSLLDQREHVLDHVYDSLSYTNKDDLLSNRHYRQNFFANTTLGASCKKTSAQRLRGYSMPSGE